VQDRFFAGLTIEQARSAVIGAIGVRPERVGLRITTDSTGVKVEAARKMPDDLQARALTALHNIALAAPTMDYGTWGGYHRGGRARLEDTVYYDFLGDFPDLYDVNGLIEAYRAAIIQALPQGVNLANDNHFYGPYPVDEELKAEIRDAIDEVDSGIRRMLKEYEVDMG
jgi:hypothetical protein